MADGNQRGLFDEEFLVRLQQLHLIAKRLAGRGATGQQRSRRLGDGLEFADHRLYAPGDDIRFIDWPYYARMERLLLRMFHEHSEAPVAILLDASASMAPGGRTEKFDYARRVAAALAYVAIASLRRVTIQPFAEELAEAMHTGRNRGQIFQVLGFLAALPARGGTEFGRCAERLAGQFEPGGTVLVLSDLLDCGEGLSDGLARLRYRDCDASVLHVYTPSEAWPDSTGPSLLQQAETGERMALQITQAIRESYRRQWRQFQAACQRTCLSRGATYVATSTDLPFDRLVLQTLRRAGVVSG